MKKFTKGFASGVAATLGIATGALLAVKRAVVTPVENQLQKEEDNRKKALRKSRSTHQS